MSDGETDSYVTTAAVDVRLDRLEPVRGGSLFALLHCTLSIGDVELTLHGVGVMRAPDGQLCARSPMYKLRDGTWRPAIGLPKSVWNALIELVFDELDDTCDPRNSRPAGGL